MEQLKNEQTQTTAQSVETESELGEKVDSVSFGKFKDAEALLNAYNSLRSEFTKRCQRIKELEGLFENVDKTQVPAKSTSEESPVIPKDITLEEKEKILKDYLKEVMGAKSKALVLDGVGEAIQTPANKPKTIEEAGILLRESLKK